MKKKRILISVMAGTLVLCALVSCGKKKNNDKTDNSSVSSSEVVSSEVTTSEAEASSEETISTSFDKPVFTTSAESSNESTTVLESSSEVEQVNLLIYSNYDIRVISSKVDKGSNGNVPSCPFEREHYTCIGYSTTADGSVEYGIEDNITYDSDLSLYAIWQADSVKLTLHLDNSTYNFQSEIVNTSYDKAIKLPEPDLSSYGLKFLGWSKSVYYPTSPSEFTIDYEGKEFVKISDLKIVNGEAHLYGCYINPSAHVYNSGEVINEAKLGQDGIKRYTCTTTGHSDYYDEIIHQDTLLAGYVESVFYINGRGTVATVYVKQGSVSLNDTVRIILRDGSYKEATVTGIEINRKTVDDAYKGDSCGLLLRGVEKADIESAVLICQPEKEIKSKFLYMKVNYFSPEEGGKKVPFFKEYKPTLVFDDCNSLSGQVEVNHIFDLNNQELEMAMPGSEYYLDVEVLNDEYLPIWKGFTGLIRDSGRTVGTFEIIEVASSVSLK